MVNLKLINNSEEHYEFIRELRVHPDNISGFIEQVEITPEQQIEYMSKYRDNYYIALEDNRPVGWVGVIDGDIRVCVHPEDKGKGVGKFMIDELMKIHPKSYAKVLWGNDPSQRLFHSCGFKPYSKDRNFIYLRKHGV